jgi:5-methylcytosine-specific restriction endonuclease McrA
VSDQLRKLIAARANNCCEYCQLAESESAFVHQVEHIIARKHRGETSPENLCLACFECNEFKGSNIAGLDPETGELARLFHPRVDNWNEHFEWHGARLVGLTAIGRTTIEVLKINEFERLTHRRLISRRKR